MTSNLRDVMLDLETMGSNSKSAIVAIGAVAFDLRGGVVSPDTFYEVVDLASSVRLGGTVDPATIYWWLQQSAEARQALLAPSIALPAALTRFTEFIQAVTIGREDVRLWGNGSDFDNVILGSAFDRAHLQRPWKFTHNRCYHTVKNLFRNVLLADLPSAGSDVAHHALVDAMRQTKHLIAISRLHLNNLGEDHTR